MADIYEQVKAYFKNEEWGALGDLDKLRHTKMYENYTALVKDGIPVKMPDFMVRKSPDKPKRSVYKDKKKKRKFEDENKENFKPKIKNLSDNQAPRRNPRRNVRPIRYFDPEVPSSDSYVYCDICEEDVEEFCKKCGILSHLRDNPIPIGTKDRARKTLPRGILTIKPSPLHGLGVFTLRRIPQGLRMGPYEGAVSRDSNDNGYCWKMRGGHVVDAEDTANSNWMRYVNCARHQNEQNLVAFQFRGALYYRTFRALRANEELLVYYGDDFARTLGLDVDAYYEPRAEALSTTYSCTYCCFGFSELKYLVSHKTRCPGNTKEYIPEGVFSCSICKVTLASEKFLDAHEKYCKFRSYNLLDPIGGNRKEEKKHKCNECHYQTNILSSFKNHMRIHNKEKPFQCTYCDQKFRQFANLQTHINDKHTKKKVHCCNFCTYNSTQKGNLNRHIKVIHKSIKPFLCDICKRRFTRKTNLQKHAYVHTKTPKPYDCLYCPFSTAWKEYLKTHTISQHSNERPYKCTTCNYATAMYCNLKSHMHTHTNVKPFHCLQCNYQCCRLFQLKKHVTNQHPTIQHYAK